ncbi:MAG: ABC transporter ATP-binding protein [Coriobacteriia bacterium]|nr:ABC transporter ATP-binding protein [Coriobacteriia bacterium]MCL2870036.1 ABC transporter ATP-binding protein [Coriobacteriia bacterium]
MNSSISNDTSKNVKGSENEAIIKTHDLVKTYTKGKIETYALRGVSMEIPRGSFSCIIGPSGHGKSTLMHLIGGLDRASSGDVVIDGIKIADLNDNELSELRASKIGFVFQFFNLLQNLTAVENIETAMMFSKNAPGNSKEQRVKALELLRLVGLEDKAHAKPNELSGGQQQRVSIARSLANDPEILLMDEPTGNLDSKSEEEVLDQLLKIHATGKTVVIVTHNTEVSDRAEILYEVRDGKLNSVTKR